MQERHKAQNVRSTGKRTSLMVTQTHLGIHFLHCCENFTDLFHVKNTTEAQSMKMAITAIKKSTISLKFLLPNIKVS